MDIQIISDTHNIRDIKSLLNPKADLIAHIGDFKNTGFGLDQVKRFVEACNELNVDHLIVLGNHDYYCNSIYLTSIDIKNITKNVLINGSTYVKDGITFVGGTLFTNFSNDKFKPRKTMNTCKKYIHDFQSIFSDFNVTSTVDPKEYISIYNHTMKNIEQYRHQENVVVMTHFLPHKICIDPKYAVENPKTPDENIDYMINSYFANDIDLKGFKTWIFGHTHTAQDFTYDGCHLVCNPYGYTTERGRNGYVPFKLITV